MHEIICPHCGKAFKIDEAGYADIVKQVRDGEFEQQLHERLELAEQDKRNAVELATTKSQTRSLMDSGALRTRTCVISNAFLSTATPSMGRDAARSWMCVCRNEVDCAPFPLRLKVLTSMRLGIKGCGSKQSRFISRSGVVLMPERMPTISMRATMASDSNPVNRP